MLKQRYNQTVEGV